MVIQLAPRSSDNMFNKRANRDVATLWSNTKTEGKEALARTNFDTTAKTKSPTVQRIQRDIQRIRDQQAKAKARAKANTKPAQRDALDDLFDAL